MVAAARVADFCVVPSDFRFIRVFRVFFDLDPTSLPLDSSKLVGLVRSLARAQREVLPQYSMQAVGSQWFDFLDTHI